ncbi:MAG: DUF1232 domain-containing protein [Rhodocyclaceae bacterium]|nr:DUF1232 domain-containing protein [Rhodocyclaceae bacterium]
MGWDRLKDWARTVKRDAHALWLAARDSRVPWYVKIVALAVAAYALSPVDLIPDFIPIVGYLDDLIIVPLGIMIVVRMIPPELMQEFRSEAMAARNRPVSRVAAGMFLLIWIMCALWFGSLAMHALLG